MLVRIDASTPALYHLDVDGVLDFQEDTSDTPATLVLEAVHVVVRGRLNINGTSANGTSTYRGKAEISLNGDRSEPGYQVDGVDYGCKVLIVLGELNLLGEQRGTSRWMRLESSAGVGDKTITIENGTNWLRAGDKVVLAPTGFEPREADELTVESVSNSGADQQVTFVEALQYIHTSTTITAGNKSAIMQGEVMLLSSNVVIRGGDHSDFYGTLEQEFGARLLVPRHASWDAVKQRVNIWEGKVQLLDVELVHGGQASNAFGKVIDFWQISVPGSSIIRCALHDNFNVGISLAGTGGMTISDNVVYHNLGTSYSIIGGSGTPNKVFRNIASRMVVTIIRNGVETRNVMGADGACGACKDPWMCIPAGFNVAGAFHDFVGNVVAGSDKIGFLMPGSRCRSLPGYNMNKVTRDPKEGFSNNVVHTTAMGIGWKGSCIGTDCMEYNDVTVYNTWGYGYWIHAQCSVRVKGNALVNNIVGVALYLAGTDAKGHTIEDTLHWKVEDTLVSNQELVPCGTIRPAASQAEMYPPSHRQFHAGLILPTFTGGTSNIVPKMFEWSAPQEHSGYPPLHASAYVHDVVFHGFKTDSCGRKHRAITSNKLASDTIHPTYFTGIQYVDVEGLNKFYIHPPPGGWVVLDNCVTMDCDGPKHALLDDQDGTLLGTGVPGTLIARAEYASPEASGYKAPEKFLTDSNGARTPESEKINQYGIVRPGCVLTEQWNAWKCVTNSSHLHRMMVIESMDGDSEHRSLVPVVLSYGKTSDLMNGGQDHGKLLLLLSVLLLTRG